MHFKATVTYRYRQPSYNMCRVMFGCTKGVCPRVGVFTERSDKVTIAQNFCQLLKGPESLLWHKASIS